MKHESNKSGIELNLTAPLFELQDVFDRMISLSNYKGKKVFVGFFRPAIHVEELRLQSIFGAEYRELMVERPQIIPRFPRRPTESEEESRSTFSWERAFANREIRSAGQQMCGEAVAQGVRTDAGGGADAQRVFLDQRPDRLPAKSTAAMREDEPLGVRSRRRRQRAALP